MTIISRIIETTVAPAFDAMGLLAQDITLTTQDLALTFSLLEIFGVLFLIHLLIVTVRAWLTFEIEQIERSNPMKGKDWGANSHADVEDNNWE